MTFRGAYVIVADDAADEAAMVDVAARMTAAGKPATVYRLGRARSDRQAGSGG
jgi:hypothetical protein